MSSIINSKRFQQRLAEEQREREEREAAERQAAADRARENEELREERKAKIAADKKEHQKKVDAEWELALASDKQRLMREWLANNVGKNAADFELRAWPHLRLNLIEDRQRQADEQHAALLRATGNYRM
jgi:flagellar biosynthesis GTPase FlhF